MEKPEKPKNDLNRRGKEAEEFVGRLLPHAVSTTGKPQHDFVLPNGKLLEVKNAASKWILLTASRRILFDRPNKTGYELDDHVSWHNKKAHHLIAVSPEDVYFIDVEKLRKHITQTLKKAPPGGKAYFLAPDLVERGIAIAYSKNILASKKGTKFLNKYFGCKVA